MNHSMYSYLKRRSTEELENVLQIWVGDESSGINKEVIKLTVQILCERNSDWLNRLSSESMEELVSFLQNACEEETR